MTRLNVLALEPWLGGSHAGFLDAWRRHSEHRIEVAGLPDRQWRWRMRDGARRLAELAPAACEPFAGPPDVLLASDYLDVPGCFGFLPGAWSRIPLVLYFHENQLTYPRAPGQPEPDPERDRHFAYTHILSCLRAAKVVFNSDFHRREFGTAAEAFLKRLPNDAPRAAFAEAMKAAEVVGPGVDLGAIAMGPGGGDSDPLGVAFPHRWEHDKDPRAFLLAVLEVLRGGGELQLHLFGERYRDLPDGVAELLDQLRPAVVSDGFRPSFEDYARDLGRADLVVSTARHEFYGIAVLEAMAAGCAPLLPNRLAYPELLGEGHADRLYGPGQLVERLAALAAEPSSARAPAARAVWRSLAEGHRAERTAAGLDRIVAELPRD